MSYSTLDKQRTMTRTPSVVVTDAVRNCQPATRPRLNSTGGSHLRHSETSQAPVSLQGGAPKGVAGGGRGGGGGSGSNRHGLPLAAGMAGQRGRCSFEKCQLLYGDLGLRACIPRPGSQQAVRACRPVGHFEGPPFRAREGGEALGLKTTLSRVFCAVKRSYA